MKLRSKRWQAKNGAKLRRARRRHGDRRHDPELKAMREAVTAQKRAEGHPGYPAPYEGGRSWW